MSYESQKWKPHGWTVMDVADTTNFPSTDLGVEDILVFQGTTAAGTVDRIHKVGSGAATVTGWATNCVHQTSGLDRVYLTYGGKPFTVFRKASPPAKTTLECRIGHVTDPAIGFPTGPSWTATEGG